MKRPLPYAGRMSKIGDGIWMGDFMTPGDIELYPMDEREVFTLIMNGNLNITKTCINLEAVNVLYFEMANNHQGSVEHAKTIVDEFAKVANSRC